MLNPDEDESDGLAPALEDYGRQLEEEARAEDEAESGGVGIEGVASAAGFVAGTAARFVGKVAAKSARLLLREVAHLIAELRLLERVDGAIARRARRRMLRDLHRGTRAAGLRDRCPGIPLPKYTPRREDDEEDQGEPQRDLDKVMEDKPDKNDPAYGWYYPAHYDRPCGTEPGPRRTDGDAADDRPDGDEAELFGEDGP